jgi:hypothetical protein
VIRMTPARCLALLECPAAPAFGNDAEKQCVRYNTGTSHRGLLSAFPRCVRRYDLLSTLPYKDAIGIMRTVDHPQVRAISVIACGMCGWLTSSIVCAVLCVLRVLPAATHCGPSDGARMPRDSVPPGDRCCRRIISR